MQSIEHSGEVLSLRLSLEKEIQRKEQLEQELRSFKSSTSRKNLNGNLQKQSDELLTVRQRLEDELKERERLEAENQALREQIGLLGEDGDEVRFSSRMSFFSNLSCRPSLWLKIAVPQPLAPQYKP